MTLAELNEATKDLGLAGYEYQDRYREYQQIDHQETKTRFLRLYLMPIYLDLVQRYVKPVI